MKKFFKIILCFLCVIILVGVPFIKIDRQKIKGKKSYKTILQIWNIDSFEGGVGSRTSFLRKVSIKFSSKHKEVLCLVVNHTKESANNLLKKGEVPDIISSGICGIECSKYLKPLNQKGFNDGGIVNNKRYFISWCKGGYFKITKNSSNLKVKETIIKEEKNSLAIIPVILEDIKCENIILKDKDSAVNYFLSKENAMLIGTQRDVIKLQNRNIDCLVEPLNTYNDLYQYAYITSQTRLGEYYSQLFLDMLLSKEIQENLDSICMLSNKFSGISSENFYKDYESKSSNFTLSPLLTQKEFENISNIAKDVLNKKRSKEEVVKLLKQLKNT